MRHIILISIIIILTSCSGQPTSKNDDSKYFAYYVDFYPSFLPSSRIQIKKTNNIGSIKMTVYEFRSKTKNIAYSDSLILDKNDLEYFFSYLDTIRLVKIKSVENERGVDGITVYNAVYQDSIENKFQFWSPDKKERPVEHRIVEAVIGLSRKKFNDIKHQEYFESLEQYFDFGLPCKRISDNPLEVRIYGSLSSDEVYQLTNFIDSLPSDKPILIDMTNFGGMGTILYPIFQSLIKRNNKIIWATEYKTQLKAIGVDTTSIVDNIQEGRIKIKNYCR